MGLLRRGEERGAIWKEEEEEAGRGPDQADVLQWGRMKAGRAAGEHCCAEILHTLSAVSLPSQLKVMPRQESLADIAHVMFAQQQMDSTWLLLFKTRNEWRLNHKNELFVSTWEEQHLRSKSDNKSVWKTDHSLPETQRKQRLPYKVNVDCNKHKCYGVFSCYSFDFWHIPVNPNTKSLRKHPETGKKK